MSTRSARLATRTMTFTLVVPQRAAADMPFVLALHYASDTGVASRPFVETLVAPAVDDALVLAPDQDAFGPFWATRQAEDRLAALVDAAVQAWPVDPNRVVVLGYSDGGIGVWSLTARYPDRFSAGLPVASRPFGGPHGAVPLYLIHGDRDTVHDLSDVEAAYEELRQEGAQTALDVIEAGHADVPAYVPALRRGMQWVRAEVWE